MPLLNTPQTTLRQTQGFFQQQAAQQRQLDLEGLNKRNIESQIGLRDAQTGAVGQVSPESGSSVLARIKSEFLQELLDPNTPTDRRELIQKSGIFGSPQTNISIDTGSTRETGEQQFENLKVLQEVADRINESGINPNAEAVVKTNTQGVNVISLEQKPPAAAGERKDITDAQASIDSLDNLKALFDDPKSKTGIIPGATTQALGLIGKTTQEQENLQAATFAFKNRIIKQITGAQMSEQEAKRIMKQVPDLGDPPTRWKAKFEQTVKNLKILQKRRTEILKASGVRATGTTKKPITPTATQPTTAPQQLISPPTQSPPQLDTLRSLNRSSVPQFGAPQLSPEIQQKVEILRQRGVPEDQIQAAIGQENQ
jgi:hypothetical protein